MKACPLHPQATRTPLFGQPRMEVVRERVGAPVKMDAGCWMRLHGVRRPLHFKYLQTNLVATLLGSGLVKRSTCDNDSIVSE
jgi:hypothetical protein